MRLEEIGGYRGPTDNAAEAALLDNRIFEARLATHAFPDLYVVYDYNHVAGTVDLLPKTNPNGSVVYGVPVHGMGGSLRTYYGFRTMLSGSAEPDVGWLVFPKADSRRAFADFLVKVPSSARILQPFGAEFQPSVPVASQSNPPNVVATGPGKATEIAPGDKALVDPVTGSGIIVKASGAVVIVGSGKVYLLGPGQDYGDATGISLGGGPSEPASGRTFSS